MKKNYLLIIITALLLIAASPAYAQPLTPANKFPRLANYYLGDLNRADYDKLSRYDLLLLIPETQYYFKDFFAYARARNPDIIILPYIPSQSINLEGLNDPDGLKQAFYQLGTDARYLKNSRGEKISLLRDILPVVDVTTDWNSVMPQVVQDKILSTGLWDGIFYDIVESGINHYGGGDIDMNRDGVKDDLATVNVSWRNGMTELLENTRNILGPNKYLIINGDSYAGFQPYVNGRLFESFPTPWEAKGQWQDSARAYFNLPKLQLEPNANILNSNTGDTGNERVWQKIRLGLTSTLLGNGYFAFDYGITSHHQLWWYDEFDQYLGRPLSPARNLLNSSSFGNSLWRRDFEKGAVFVNSTGNPQEINLEEEFESVHGIQDPNHNNGLISSDISLAPNDGIILLRPISTLFNSAYVNGAFTRIFTDHGVTKRAGFFTYSSPYRGTTTVAELDTQSGTHWVVADGGQIKLFNKEGILLNTLFPYGANFRGTISFILADLNEDGKRDILTVPVKGGSVHIVGYTTEGKGLPINFIADKRSLLNPTLGILKNPTRIVLGATRGDKPIVKIYSLQGKILSQWGAFEGNFNKGINVTVTQLNNGWEQKIIVGRGQGGAPEVRTFTPQGKLTGIFFPFTKTNKSGVRVANADIDGDGNEEILTATTQVFTVANRAPNY